MIRSQLVEQIREDYPNLDVETARKVVDVFFKEIIQALSEGRRCELRSFGSFSVKTLPPRLGRNPKNGDTVQVPERSVMRFRASSLLLEKLNKEPESDRL